MEVWQPLSVQPRLSPLSDVVFHRNGSLDGLELRAVFECHNLGGVLGHRNGGLVLLGDFLSHACAWHQARGQHRAGKHACRTACQQPCGNPSLHDASPFFVAYRMHADTPLLGRASLLTRRPSDSA